LPATDASHPSASPDSDATDISRGALTAGKMPALHTLQLPHMADDKVLTPFLNKYRDELVGRERIAKRDMVTNYRSAWRGLEPGLEDALGGLSFDAEEQALLDSAVVADPNADANATPKVSADKIGKIADMLLKKSKWAELEDNIDSAFSEVAGSATAFTELDRKELGNLAVSHAIELLDIKLGKNKPDQKQLDVLHRIASSQVENFWKAKQEDLVRTFQDAARAVSERARKALRQEALIAVLQRVRGKEILNRVKTAIDEREKDPDKDPALVIALRSEYRIATIESYRTGLLQTFQASGVVKHWRWQVEPSPSTCAICWGMNGQVFPIETKQRSHPNCRCTMVPLTEDEERPGSTQTPAAKSGKKIGGTTAVQTQPLAERSPGDKAFAALPEKVQLTVLGATAFEAYQKGEFELVDLVGVQYSEKLGTDTLYRKSLDNAILTINRTNVSTTVQEQMQTGQLARRREAQIKMARLEANRTATTVQIRDIDYDVKYKQVSHEAFKQLQEGFSQGNIGMPLDIQILRLLPDARMAALKTAAYFYARVFQIPIEAVDKLLSEYTDENAVRELGASANMSADEFKIKLGEEWKRIDAEEKAGKKPKPYFFFMTSDFRQRLYEIYVADSGDKKMQDDLALEKLIRAKEAELKKDEPSDDLRHAFWDWKRQMAIKDLIRDFYEGRDTDYRTGDNEAQTAANKFADGLESFFNFAIDSHPVLGPLLSLMPSLKQRVVNFGVGAVNGLGELALMATGGELLLADLMMEAVIGTMDITGLSETLTGKSADTLRALNEQMKQKRMEAFNAFTDLKTTSMSREEQAYSVMKRLKLDTTVWDTPNWAAKAGKMTIEALPFIALAFATEGASLGVQVGVFAGASGSGAFNSTYAKTNNVTTALVTGGIAAAQGGLGVLSGRLPILGNLAADALTTYTIGKMTGQSDDLILQQIFLQSGLNLTIQGAQKGLNKTQSKAPDPLLSRESFEPGGRMNEELTRLYNENLPEGGIRKDSLTLKEAQKAMLGIFSESVAPTVNEMMAAGRNKFQLDAVKKKIENPDLQYVRTERQLYDEYGRQNTYVTRADAKEAYAELQAAMRKNAAGGETIELSKLSETARLAAFHIEQGTVKFADFLGVMKSYKGIKDFSIEQLETLYREAIANVIKAKQKANPQAEVSKWTPDEPGIGSVKIEEAKRVAAREKARVAEENAAARREALRQKEADRVRMELEKNSEGRVNEIEKSKPADSKTKETPKQIETPKKPSEPPKAIKENPQLMQKRESLATEEAKQAYDAIYDAMVASRNAKKPDTKRFQKNIADLETTARRLDISLEMVLEHINSLAEHRATSEMSRYEYTRSDTGTVTRIADTDIFGQNTNAKGGKDNPANEKPRRDTYLEMKQRGLLEESVRFKDDFSNFLTHAEADALIQMNQRNGGNFPDEVLMFVDRRTCSIFCISTIAGRKGLSALVEYYGIKQLTIVDSLGTQYIVRPKLPTEVIERAPVTATPKKGKR
jgi:hypothetical protein